jgi:signal transduction histidine kinase/CheY-like chemotaxis protein
VKVIRFFKYETINTRLMLLVLAAVVPCLAILLYSGIEYRNHMVADSRARVRLLAHNLAVAQNAATRSTEQILSTLARLPSVQGMDSAACSGIFTVVLEENPEFTNIALVDRDGNVLVSGKPIKGKNLADRKHVKDAMEKRQFAVGEYIISRVSDGTPAFAFAYPLLGGEDRVRAVLTVAVKLNIFSQMHDVSELPEKSFIALTDHQGIRLFYYPPRKDTNPVGKKIRGEPWNIALEGGDDGFLTSEGSDGLRRILAYEKVRQDRGSQPYLYVWAGIPEGYVLQAANTSMVRNVLLLVVATLTSLFLSWLIGRKVLITPIQDLVALTRKFAGGDLGARGELSASTAELGSLNRAFNDMADSLVEGRKTLEESESKFRSMMDAMTDPIYICSPDFRVEYMNRAMVNRVGYDATGEYCFSSLHGLHEKCSWCKFDRVRQGQSIDFEIVSPKDNRFYLLSHYPFVQKEGTVSKMTVYKDMTELRNVEAQLRQAQKMESIGRLAGGVAHDYNNVLSVIIGFTQLSLDRLDPDDPLSANLNEVLKAADRATQITRQLLAFARKQTIAPRILDLNESVGSMLKMLRRLIGEDIDLVWLPGSDVEKVMMDPSQVDQILANLCVNSRDAIDGVGKITIETAMVSLDEAYCRNNPGFSPGEFVMLSVSDNGCGIKKEIMENIFEPFFTTKSADKGTGLGLAMIYGMVKQNNGFINVYSEPDSGTTIRIYLPGQEGEATSSAAVYDQEDLQGEGETILIVEDEASILKLARQILTEFGYNVLSAQTPEAAIHLSGEYRGEIHLLLTDVIMPEMNGLELSNRLQAAHPNIKRVFMSGYTADAIAHHGVLDKGVHFVQKPFSRLDIAAAVKKALGEGK